MDALLTSLTATQTKMNDLDFALKSQKELLRQKMEQLEEQYIELDELESLLIPLQDEQEAQNARKGEEALNKYNEMITDLALYRQGVRDKVRNLKMLYTDNMLFQYETTTRYFIDIVSYYR
eukprot:UN08503